jgi:nucleotide-binding universal stress UspA family protein
MLDNVQNTAEQQALGNQEEQHQERIHEIVHQAETGFQPKRVICIPVDSSKHSSFLVDWAIETIINKDTDQVVLLNVRPFAYTGSFPYILPSEAINQMETNLRQTSHALLTSFAKSLVAHKIHTRAVALCGDAREELEFKINKLKPDFVLVGTRGLGTVSRAILGSVSAHLLHTVKVPVMVVPMQ